MTATGFVNTNDFTIFVSNSSLSDHFWMLFVTDQDAMSCFNHPTSCIHNLALDSNSAGKHHFGNKSAIFSTPKTWY